MRDLTDLLTALREAKNLYDTGRTVDLLSLVDAVVKEAEPVTSGDRLILLSWSPALGQCYECGLPAAFAVPDAYGPNIPLSDHHKRCAVCAVNDAVDGERITRLEET